MIDADITTVWEADDGSKGYRFALSSGSRAGAPEQADERLRVPAKLLPRGQREALIGQLKRRQQRNQSPLAFVMLDFDYYWVRPAKVSIAEFLQSSKDLNTKVLTAVLES